MLRLQCIYRTEWLCVVLWIYFSFSLSHSSCLWGESQRRGGFLSEGECVVCTWIVFALSSGLCSSPPSSVSLSVREQMSGAPPVTCNYTSKQTKTTEQQWCWITPGLWSYNTADTTLRDFLTHIIHHNIPDHLSSLKLESGYTQACPGQRCLIDFSLTLI